MPLIQLVLVYIHTILC